MSRKRTSCSRRSPPRWKPRKTVKDQQILVIVGNPPYAATFEEQGNWIMAAIEGYKFTIETLADGYASGPGPEEHEPLGERNPRALNDDYVKFIRFAPIEDGRGRGRRSRHHHQPLLAR